MDHILSSDDSCSDSEAKLLKSELTEYGLDEENLSKEEMSDLLKALRNSKSTSQEEDVNRDNEKTEDVTDDGSPVKKLKRRYLNVKDRRMPWSLLPGTLSQAEKAQTLAVYIKLMSINKYCRARQCANFATWPPPLQIVEESTRVLPIRSTRSGRSVPMYSGFDEDDSDFDFHVTKPKKRKVGTDTNDDIYTNKIVSLKRKPSRDENNRLAKDSKIIELPGNTVKARKDLFTLIED